MGFFNTSQVRVKKVKKVKLKASSNAELKIIPIKEQYHVQLEEAYSRQCGACTIPEQTTNINPKIPPSGSEHPDIYILGEAPGCISGDSLIDVCYRDKTKYPDGISIKSLVGRKDFFVYSLDVEKNKLVLGNVKRVWKTGRKKVYEVTYEWWCNRPDKLVKFYNSLVVTKSHPFLLRGDRIKSSYTGNKNFSGKYLSIKDGLRVGHSLEPFYRNTSDYMQGYSSIRLGSKKSVNEGRFLLECKVGMRLGKKEQCHHKDKVKLNDSYDNLEVQTLKNHGKIHSCFGKDNVMSDSKIKEKHLKIVQSESYRNKQSKIMKDKFKDLEVYNKRLEMVQSVSFRKKVSTTVKQLFKNPEYYYRYLKGKQKYTSISNNRIEQLWKKKFSNELFPLRLENHKIISIEDVGYEDVYDMEVERFHNFAVNGIFVHNSEEDKEKIQFIGASGDILRDVLTNVFGTDYITSKIRFNNSVRCRPPSNRNPSDIELSACRKSIESDILKTKPQIIIGFGAVPLNWAIGMTGILAWRGRVIPVNISGYICWYFASLHPAFLLRQRRKFDNKEFDSEYDYVFKRDLLKVRSLLHDYKKPIIEKDYDSGIKIISKGDGIDFKILKESLERYKKYEKIALDIETVGTDPYSKDFKIVAMSIGTDTDVLAFPVEWKNIWGELEVKVLSLIKEFILISKKKIVHNLKFELYCFQKYFGQSVLFDTEWEDTMLQAYRLDERIGSKVGGSTLNLDSLCLMNFGFNLKKQNNIDVGNILSNNLVDVLRYTGMDVKWTYKLDFVQITKMNRQLRSAYRSDVNDAISLTVMQSKPIPIDSSAITILSNILGEGIIKVDSMIPKIESVKRFEDMYDEFNPSSNKHLVTLFRNILKYKSVKSTGKGNYSVDEEVLKMFADKHKDATAKCILKRREASKLKSTYVDSLPKLLHDDGYLHPEYSSVFVRTSRISSRKPNMQNFPKKRNSHIRCVIIPPKDHKIVQFDYGQIEARVFPMVSDDNNLVKMFWSDFDIHKDWALKVARKYIKAAGVNRMRDLTEDVLKKFREKIKNGIVFPWFYGSSYYSTSKNLNIPIDIMKELYKEFWEIFSGVKDWQNKTLKFYEKNGYIQTLGGKRRHAPLSKNQILNSPISGTASEIVLDALFRCMKLGYEANETKYQAAFEIHDDITFFIPIKTLKKDIEFIGKQLVCSPLKYITVPLIVDCSVGDNWAEMKEWGMFDSRDYS